MLALALVCKKIPELCKSLLLAPMGQAKEPHAKEA